MCFARLTKKQVTLDAIISSTEQCTDMMDTVFDISDQFKEDEYLLICDNLQLLMTQLKQMTAYLSVNAKFKTPSDTVYDSLLEGVHIATEGMTTPNALNKVMEFDKLKSYDMKWRNAVDHTGAETYIFEQKDPHNAFMCVYSGEFEGMWDMKDARPKKMSAMDVFKLFQLDHRAHSPELVEQLKQMGAIRWVTEGGKIGYSLLHECVPKYYTGQDVIVNGIKYQKLCGRWYDDETGERVPEELVGQP